MRAVFFEFLGALWSKFTEQNSGYTREILGGVQEDGSKYIVK